MQQKIQAAKLNDSWLTSFDSLRVLSLDCFDTLLWRKVVAPTDVFFALAQSEEFKRHGLTASLRVNAEKTARNKKLVRSNSSEISIEEIYRAALPAASPADIADLAAREVACEVDYCFVFKPVFELILQAKSQGLKVIIVSDTYLSEAQLKTLLFSVMPELEGLIDAVFCSNVHGLSKAAGIWRKILPILQVQPGDIVHLGDNEEADLKGALRFGIRATHLVQQTQDVGDILSGRLQVAVQLLPQLRDSAPVPSYFHAQLAAAKDDADHFRSFGYVSLGPIMWAFAKYILDEANCIATVNSSLKVAFLMRDGFLPSKACAQFSGEIVGSNLNISRFTAIAASLDSEDRVVSLLAKSLTKESIPALVKQLLLPSALAVKILSLVAKSEFSTKEFSRLVLQKENLKVIFSESQSLRKRLVKHIQKTTGVQSGDTLMFVDLGYSGTAQTLIKDLLKEDLNVDLIGRYLIAAEVSAKQQDRKGLLDASWMDRRITTALTGTYIAAFEMLCTQNGPSTVGYSELGDPVFSQTALIAKQYSSVERIQEGCLQFISDESRTDRCYKPSKDSQQIAHSVAIDLARMLYFPTSTELACLRDFQFDFNLGTDMEMPIFDLDKGLRDMQREGFAYMNAGLKECRTGYPMEMRFMDLSLSALLFNQNRFGFDVTPAQVSYRQETIPVMAMNDDAHSTSDIVATLTYDGYFSLLVPLSSKFHVGILLGRKYSWIQIGSIQIIADKVMHSGTDMTLGMDVIFDQMQHHGNNLFQLETDGMIYMPCLSQYGSGQICRLVFRPIAKN